MIKDSDKGLQCHHSQIMLHKAILNSHFQKDLNTYPFKFRLLNISYYWILVVGRQPLKFYVWFLVAFEQTGSSIDLDGFLVSFYVIISNIKGSSFIHNEMQSSHNSVTDVWRIIPNSLMFENGYLSFSTISFLRSEWIPHGPCWVCHICQFQNLFSMLVVYPACIWLLF